MGKIVVLIFLSSTSLGFGEFGESIPPSNDTRDTLQRLWGLSSEGNALSVDEVDTLHSLASRVPGYAPTEDVTSELMATLMWWRVPAFPLPDLPEPIELHWSPEIHTGNSLYKKLDSEIAEVHERRAVLVFETNLDRRRVEKADEPFVLFQADSEIGYSNAMLYELYAVAQAAEASKGQKILFEQVSDAMTSTPTLKALVNDLPDSDLKQRLVRRIQKPFELTSFGGFGRAGATTSDALKQFVDQAARVQLAHLSGKARRFVQGLGEIPDSATFTFADPKSKEWYRKSLQLENRDEHLSFSAFRGIGIAEANHIPKVILRIGAGHLSGTWRIVREYLTRNGLETKLRLRVDASLLEDPDFLALEKSSDALIRKQCAETRRDFANIPPEFLVR